MKETRRKNLHIPKTCDHNGDDSKVIDTDVCPDGRRWRFRQCLPCGDRYVTWEYAVNSGDVQYKVPERQSDLDQPVWAVISALRVESADLTYAEAQEVMGTLIPEKGAELCIITQEAASRFSTRGIKGNDLTNRDRHLINEQ